MGALISQVCIDCADPLRLARWWAEVLGWEVDDPDDPADDEVWIAPRRDDDVGGLIFVRVPEGKVGKNRLHLDLRPTDGSSQPAELDRLLALGARHVDIGQGDASWFVLADPDGNEICLLRSTPDDLARERLAETLTADTA